MMNYAGMLGSLGVSVRTNLVRATFQSHARRKPEEKRETSSAKLLPKY